MSRIPILALLAVSACILGQKGDEGDEGEEGEDSDVGVDSPPPAQQGSDVQCYSLTFGNHVRELLMWSFDPTKGSSRLHARILGITLSDLTFFTASNFVVHRRRKALFHARNQDEEQWWEVDLDTNRIRSLRLAATTGLVAHDSGSLVILEQGKLKRYGSPRALEDDTPTSVQDVPSLAVGPTFAGHDGRLYTMARPEDSEIDTADEDPFRRNKLQVYDARTGAPEAQLVLEDWDSEVRGLSFDRAGDLLVFDTQWTAAGYRLARFDAASGALLGEVHVPLRTQSPPIGMWCGKALPMKEIEIPTDEE